ncbi:ABC transporter family substrate-binding protein [Actinomadura alba]
MRRAGAVAVAVLLTGGCGERPVPGQTEWEPAPGLPAFDINPVPREQLRTGGTLRWALAEFPRQWNLSRGGGGPGPAADVLSGLLPYVMRCDEKAVPHPDPDYVKDVTVSGRSDRQVVTYALNPRAAWSDGRPITYRDYAAQARALSGRDERFRPATVPGYDRIEKVARGTTDHEVVVTFSRPFAGWPSLFSPLYPAATNSDPRVFDRGWAGRIGPTAGPFRVEHLDTAAGTLTVGRDPRWWGRPPKLDRIVYQAMDVAALPAALASGRIDLMDIGSDVSAYTRAARAQGAVVRAAGGPGSRNLAFNVTRPPLSDLRVRQALMLAVDRKAVSADLDRLAQPLNNHFFLNTQAGYQDNSTGLSAYDPGRAMRLLDEAGWTRYGDRRMRNGKVLRLRFAVAAGDSVSGREALFVQEMLKRIGVTLDVETVPARRLDPGHVRRGAVDIAAFSWPGGPFPVSSLRSNFATPKGDRVPGGDPRADAAAIDEAMDRALRELDPVKARTLTNDADALIWRAASVLPLCQRPQFVAVRSTLANIGARGFYDLAYEDIGFQAGGER